MAPLRTPTDPLVFRREYLDRITLCREQLPQNTQRGLVLEGTRLFPNFKAAIYTGTNPTVDMPSSTLISRALDASWMPVGAGWGM